MSTTTSNPDTVRGVHTCDTAVLTGLTRPEAEAACGACTDSGTPLGE